MKWWQFKEVGILLQHHKVFYKAHCVTNTLSSTAALTTVIATEGGLLNFNNLNAFGAILNLSAPTNGSTFLTTLPLLFFSPFAISARNPASGQMAGWRGGHSYLDQHRRPCRSQHRCTSACRAGETGPSRRWFWSKTQWRRLLHLH